MIHKGAINLHHTKVRVLLLLIGGYYLLLGPALSGVFVAQDWRLFMPGLAAFLDAFYLGSLGLIAGLAIGLSCAFALGLVSRGHPSDWKSSPVS